ncbi:MAG: hypothetical protein RR618_09920 [Cellulosilyticaceae bacterium]
MPTIEFQNGFLCGLVATGVSLGNNEGSGGFPDGSTLTVINCDYYRGDIGDCVNYLEIDKFNTVFSSGPYYTPKSGVVVIGRFYLDDWDDFSGTRAEAILKIVTDEKVVYEGDIYEYFGVEYSDTLEKMKCFSYKSSFEISAKRLNLTDAMALELYDTFIISTE